MSFEVTVQEIVLAKLKASSSLMALITGVFDFVSEDTKMPYVTIGEDIHNDWSTETSNGTDCNITIHTWSNYLGRRETKLIQGEIYNALHKTTFTVSGYNVVLCDFLKSESFVDADDETRHGVQSFRLIIEEN